MRKYDHEKRMKVATKRKKGTGRNHLSLHGGGKRTDLLNEDNDVVHRPLRRHHLPAPMTVEIEDQGRITDVVAALGHHRTDRIGITIDANHHLTLEIVTTAGMIGSPTDEEDLLLIVTIDGKR